MPGDTNLTVRIDANLKKQADAVLSELGLNFSSAITILLKQVVREQAFPLALTLHSSNAVYADLLTAQVERKNGYQGRSGRQVLSDMREAIAEVESSGK